MEAKGEVWQQLLQVSYIFSMINYLLKLYFIKYLFIFWLNCIGKSKDSWIEKQTYLELWKVSSIYGNDKATRNKTDDVIRDMQRKLATYNGRKRDNLITISEIDGILGEDISNLEAANANMESANSAFGVDE